MFSLPLVPGTVLRAFHGTVSLLVVALWGRCYFSPHFFGPHHCTWGILVSQPEIEPTPPAFEARILNHWTAREDLVLILHVKEVTLREPRDLHKVTQQEVAERDSDPSLSYSRLQSLDPEERGVLDQFRRPRPCQLWPVGGCKSFLLPLLSSCLLSRSCQLINCSHSYLLPRPPCGCALNQFPSDLTNFWSCGSSLSIQVLWGSSGHGLHTVSAAAVLGPCPFKQHTLSGKCGVLPR